MDRINPLRITEQLNRLYNNLDLPATNAGDKQKLLAEFYVADRMASASVSRRKKIIDRLKDEYSEPLKRVAESPNTLTPLEQVAPFTLSAKVGNSREAFDKDAFIKKLSNDDKCDLSLSELKKIADSCTKKQSSATSFVVEVAGEQREDEEEE